MDIFSIDEEILADRKSSFVIRISGKKKREGLLPGDLIVVDRSSSHVAGQLALVVRNGKFAVERLVPEFIRKNDPENGDFIFGMITAMVREVA